MRLVEQDMCFKKALPDEPAFILLARDPLAPALVRMWAAARRVAIAEGARPMSDLSQVELAEREAEQMVAWRRDADESWRKQPQFDLPVRDTFAGEVTLSVGVGRLDHDHPCTMRQQDEIVCTRCNKRWGVDEAAPPCV